MSAECLREPPPPVRAELEVRAKDAHHNRLAGAGQDLAHAFLQVGLHVTVEAGIAFDDLFDGGDGRS